MKLKPRGIKAECFTSCTWLSCTWWGDDDVRALVKW
jgi:hypothetical protein